MILAIRMPQMGNYMRNGTIRQLCVNTGAELKPGDHVVEVSVDLSDIAAQDCPPIYHFRVVAREHGCIRSLSITEGDVRDVGDLLGLVSTTPDETLEPGPTRDLRTARVGILVALLPTE